jgi:hypothetical protein
MGYDYEKEEAEKYHREMFEVFKFTCIGLVVVYFVWSTVEICKRGN